MPVSCDVHREVASTLYRYCETYDDGDFDAFAALFEHGHWFMVDAPGAAPVRSWIDDNVLLYDGRTLTRHEIHNLIVQPGAGADEVTFRCRIAIWQHLAGAPAQLLMHARYAGSFRRREDGWWWHDNEIELEYAGDLSHHIRTAPPASAPSART